jgi:hypothetical protein
LLLTVEAAVAAECCLPLAAAAAALLPPLSIERLFITSCFHLIIPACARTHTGT